MKKFSLTLIASGLLVFGFCITAISVSQAGAPVASPSPSGTAAPTGGTPPPSTTQTPSVNTPPPSTRPVDPSTVTPTDRIRPGDTPTSDPSSVRPSDRIRPPDSTTTPNDPATRPDGGAIVRPGDLPPTSRGAGSAQPSSSAADPAVRRNQEAYKAAMDKCNAIPSKDSQLNCANEAQDNYLRGPQ